ncbi:MAG: PLP-dependent transferase [Deinococcota bacterium]
MTKHHTKFALETLAIHAGKQVDPATGAVVPPIHLTTTFERKLDGSYPDGYVYTRADNPNRRALEECLRVLEGGAACAAFSSGSAAAAALLRSFAPGDTVLVCSDLYHGVRNILINILQPWGLKPVFVDMTDMKAVEQAWTDSVKLLWLETPTNPMLNIYDISALADMAHAKGAQVAVDGTWTTPIVQRPLELGADFVMHATTKYLAGHSDVLGGAIIAKAESETFEQVRYIQQLEGAVPSPFDCFLVSRGISTLPYRMRAHSDNAMKVAKFLDDHPNVHTVHYPGLEHHPGHGIANKQMAMMGGMMSIQVSGGVEAATNVMNRVKLFHRATSLGGVESLLEHRRSVEGDLSTTPDDLLRVSIGLEHPDDLINDLAQALG